MNTTARDQVAEGAARLPRYLMGVLLAFVFVSGFFAGIAFVILWILAVDVQLGFEVIGSRILWCLTP